MGFGTYSFSDRQERAVNLSYDSAPVEKIFTQTKEKRAHDLMLPKGVIIRECCDSDTHPNTVPIQLYLDVTGSMLSIPEHFIREGLPDLITTLMQAGVQDPALMFGAIGDHEYDRFPLQIGQFESGDEELDMWLTRTFLEGKGGGNNGESYLLAWYFAANHVKTDAFSKRNKKGFVFTIGDEPTLENLPINALREIIGESVKGQSSFTAEELFNEASKQNHVFHIFIEHGYRVCDTKNWTRIVGENLIICNDYRKIPQIIANKILELNKHEQPNLLTDNKTSEPVSNPNKFQIPDIF